MFAIICVLYNLLYYLYICHLYIYQNLWKLHKERKMLSHVMLLCVTYLKFLCIVCRVKKYVKSGTDTIYIVEKISFIR